MREAIAALEDAFKEEATGSAVMPPRTSISIPRKDGWLGIMPAFLERAESLSTKIVTVYNGNQSRNLPVVMATIVLNNPATGEVLSIMDGTYATAMRTGALGGLAAKYLARNDAHVVGVFGAGVQARTQLAALSEVRDVTQAKVYDPITDRARNFAKEMGTKLRIPVQVCASGIDCVVGSDMIVTASTSKEPLFEGRLIRAGVHINAFGSFKPDERELDTETVKKSRVIVDLRVAAMAEAGDLIIPMKEGKIADSLFAEIGEVITGSRPGRVSSEEITLFKSVGVGIQDCAIASLAYRKAREAGIGTEITLD
jgi:ornithine cyclodeaminase/alanine dehydrogenase